MKMRSVLLYTACIFFSTIGAAPSQESAEKDIMKDVLITKLRDKTTTLQEFRNTTECLSYVLAAETANHLTTQETTVQTVLAPAQGITFSKKIVLAPVLRAGMSMLEPFLTFFPSARVAVMGLRRNEETAEAYWYYEHVPAIQPDEQVILLDPMFATGGTVEKSLDCLIAKGALEENIIYVGIISAPQAIQRIKATHPKVKMVIAAQDPILNEKSYIVPGLGDFGDLYYGA